MLYKDPGKDAGADNDWSSKKPQAYQDKVDASLTKLRERLPNHEPDASDGAGLLYVTRRWTRFLARVDLGEGKLPDAAELMQVAEQRTGIWQALSTEWFRSPQIEDTHGFNKLSDELLTPREKEPPWHI